MTDLSQSTRQSPKIDGAFTAIIVIYVCVALFLPAEFGATLGFTANAMTSTAPFIIFAVLAVAYLKATGAETLLARAFEGAQTRMIVLAALLGGLSPFCSCEVIPFIAALLAVGAPLGAVMAFWLSSPLMDPAMFAITSGTLGFDFAIAKTVAAVGLGLFGGFVTPSPQPPPANPPLPSQLALAGHHRPSDPRRDEPALGQRWCLCWQ